MMSGALRVFFYPFFSCFLWCVGMKANSLWFCVYRVVKIVGGSLSGSKVVRGMVFKTESEGAFFPLPSSSTYKTNLDQTTPRIQARSNMQPQQK